MQATLQLAQKGVLSKYLLLPLLRCWRPGWKSPLRCRWCCWALPWKLLTRWALLWGEEGRAAGLGTCKLPRPLWQAMKSFVFNPRRRFLEPLGGVYVNTPVVCFHFVGSVFGAHKMWGDVAAKEEIRPNGEDWKALLFERLGEKTRCNLEWNDEESLKNNPRKSPRTNHRTLRNL